MDLAGRVRRGQWSVFFGIPSILCFHRSFFVHFAFLCGHVFWDFFCWGRGLNIAPHPPSGHGAAAAARPYTRDDGDRAARATRLLGASGVQSVLCPARPRRRARGGGGAAGADHRLAPGTAGGGCTSKRAAGHRTGLRRVGSSDRAARGAARPAAGAEQRLNHPHCGGCAFSWNAAMHRAPSGFSKCIWAPAICCGCSLGS